MENRIESAIEEAKAENFVPYSNEDTEKFLRDKGIEDFYESDVFKFNLAIYDPDGKLYEANEKIDPWGQIMSMPEWIEFVASTDWYEQYVSDAEDRGDDEIETRENWSLNTADEATKGLNWNGTLDAYWIQGRDDRSDRSFE